MSCGTRAWSTASRTVESVAMPRRNGGPPAPAATLRFAACRAFETTPRLLSCNPVRPPACKLVIAEHQGWTEGQNVG